MRVPSKIDFNKLLIDNNITFISSRIREYEAPGNFPSNSSKQNKNNTLIFEETLYGVYASESVSAAAEESTRASNAFQGTISAASVSSSTSSSLANANINNNKKLVPITVMLRVRCKGKQGDITKDVETCGSVLCIHGFAQSRFTFHVVGEKSHQHDRSFLHYLARSGFDVFAIDLRGTSDSLKIGATPPAGVEEYVFHDAPNIFRAIKGLSGHDKSFIIGHSLG